MDADLLYNMYRFSKCKEFFCDIRDIPYAMVKGEALSLAAYKALGKRRYVDIDILVPKGYIELIEECLSGRGFVPVDRNRQDRLGLLLNSHQVLPWMKRIAPADYPNAVIYIDINFDIFWGEYEGERTDIERFLEDTQTVSVFGSPIKCLSPIKALVQLALHHYKDMNSIYLLATKKTIRYKMFEEIYYLIRNHLDSISPDGLEELCSLYHIKAYVYYVLYYTNQVYQDDVIEDFVMSLKCPEGEALLPLYGLCKAERKVWRIDFPTRLKEETLFSHIKEDLSPQDIRKIEVNRKLFQ